MKKWFAFLLIISVVQLKGQPQTYPSRFVVAQDGSGDFKTVQEAIHAVRDLSQQMVTIFIKRGTYHEKLVIPSWKTKIALVGEDRDATIISNNDYSGKAFPGGKDQFQKDKFTTYTSYTVLVQGDDFSAENLTIENTAGRVGQAVALHLEADRCVIKNCKLLGNQDTLYVAKEYNRQFFLNCEIEGTTDFIFGEATVVFQNCVIKSLMNSYVTAAATGPNQQYGFVFLDCHLIADTSAKKVFLGRPWRPHAKTVFIHCNLESHIIKEGWDNWRNPENEKTVLYAEFNNYGAGSDHKNRVNWSRQLSAKQAKQYTLENIFKGRPQWIPN